MNADELAAETKTDRIVKLALAAGRRQTELDAANAEASRYAAEWASFVREMTAILGRYEAHGSGEGLLDRYLITKRVRDDQEVLRLRYDYWKRAEAERRAGIDTEEGR